MINKSLLDLNREIVLADYESASNKNKELFFLGDVKATSEYIYDNQKEDAIIICNKFYKSAVRAIGIIKKTKVGMDGLMIEIIKDVSTHPDDNFMIHRDNCFIITGMSNVKWETDMKDKMPNCFKVNVYHHGKLQKLKNKLKDIKKALFIIDEIDTGDKENQKLHKILKDSGLLDIRYMEENNIRFIFVSATMIKELKELYKWRDKYETYYMTIPENYIGHEEFLHQDIIKEFYEIKDELSALKWIQEDIIENYGTDYRVHIIRTNEKNKEFIINACKTNNIDYKNYTSKDVISDEELKYIFDNITNHVILIIKEFYRRATLIPNKWKLKIGAIHERYIEDYDTNTQTQGLTGRMSGYWKDIILSGYKTGPYRTSINSVKEYIEWYKNPFGDIKYNTTTAKVFVRPKNIKNLEEIASKIKDDDVYKRVPVIIDGLNENDIIFKTKKKKEKLDFINSLLESDERYIKLYKFINNKDVKCVQITQSFTDNSYKKQIIEVVNAYKNNKPYIVSLKKEYKDKNNWMIFIDNREKRLCFTIWCIDSDLY